MGRDYSTGVFSLEDYLGAFRFYGIHKKPFLLPIDISQRLGVVDLILRREISLV